MVASPRSNEVCESTRPLVGMTLSCRHSVVRCNRMKRDFDDCEPDKYWFISFREIR